MSDARVIATVLFTDIVDSTRLAGELGDARWKRVLESHHATVRRELRAHGGREIDNAGDGFFATFSAPGPAIRCACAIVDSVRALGIEVRAGVHTGELERVGAKVGGIAVHIGSRIAALGGPGEVLVSATVKELSAGSDIRFDDRGISALRGVEGVWGVHAVRREGSLAVRAGATALPPDDGAPTAEGQTDSGFVGRRPEVAELEAALEGAIEGRGRLFLISGEPGIGKSRLAAELVRRAGVRGITVLAGRCWEAGGAPPFWPWVQALRPLVRDVPPDRLARHLGNGAPDVAQMLPEIRSVLPDVPEPHEADPDAARFRLFDATAQFMVRVADEEPLLLILDDLQSADVPSLLLLRFLAPELERAHLLVVATWRTGEVGGDHPLAEAVSDVLRLPATRRVELTGLSEDDVAAFVEAAAGVTPSPQQIAIIRSETEGNPLFVQEVVRLLASEGRLDEIGTGTALATIPAGVREVIGRRLLHLSDACMTVLAPAAVLGREFSLDALRRLVDRDAEELLELLDEAVAARVVTDVPGTIGALRFGHALIREVLYEDLSAAQRLRLHRRAGVVLEELHAQDLEPHLAELAHHYSLAAPVGEHAKALEYARRAGDRAARLFAFEEAVRLYGLASRMLDLDPQADDVVRCDVLLALGDAQTCAGESSGSRETFVAAAELAERLGRPADLARAALGYGGRFTWARALGDTRLISLLDAAREALGAADDPQLVRVLARLSCAMRDQHEREPRWSLSQQAVDMARRIGDPVTLAYALGSRWAAIWEPDTVEERLALADEAVGVAVRSGDKERIQEVRLARVATYFELGRIAEVRAELEDMERLATEIRQAPQTWVANVCRTLLLLFEGRFSESEALAYRTYELEVIAVDPMVQKRFHDFARARERGGVEDHEPALRDAAERFTSYPFLRCGLAVLHLEVARRAEAERELNVLAADEFAALPYDNEWLLGMSLLAEVAEGLGAADIARSAYARLAPHAHLNAVGVAEGSAGSVARYLGLLAMTVGDLDAAVRHLDDAVEMNRSMGALPWTAHAQYDLARALGARDGPGDRERAETALGEALATSDELGMTVLSTRIRSGGEAGPTPVATTGGRSGAEASATFRREGDTFAIAFEGDAFRLKDAKGLRYLARLLANPGRELHALDVAGETGAERVASGRAPAGLEAGGTGGTGPILDAKAKAAYRERLADLEREADDARTLGDDERATRAEAERDALVQQLSAAVGLGGRDRETGSAAERARVNVTRSIRSALGRIARESPALGAHFERTIHTGTFCSYAPDPRAPVTWRL